MVMNRRQFPCKEESEVNKQIDATTEPYLYLSVSHPVLSVIRYHRVALQLPASQRPCSPAASSQRAVSRRHKAAPVSTRSQRAVDVVEREKLRTRLPHLLVHCHVRLLSKGGTYTVAGSTGSSQEAASPFISCRYYHTFTIYNMFDSQECQTACIPLMLSLFVYLFIYLM